MLKRRILILFMAVLMLALPVVAAASSAVEFKDDNLQAAVIEEFANLGKVFEVSKIPQADMKLLKKLYAYGPDAADLGEPADDEEVIRDLSGLKYALNLEALKLSANFIKDLAPIRNLPLSFLDIRWNADEENGTPAFSLNPSSPQMKILQEIQHRGAVVWHDGLISRISGPDRYQTAVRIWQNMYTHAAENEDVVEYSPGNTILLARGDDFADALVGAPLAGAIYWEDDYSSSPPPILLTTSNKLHPVTKNALIKYIKKFENDLVDMGGIFDVYVLGGTAAISEAVVNELIYAIESEFEALDVRAIRLGGANRYETAVKIAEKIIDINDLYYGNEVIFASGENYPDALSAAPYAMYEEMPILLTGGDKLPECVVDFLKDLGKDFGKENFDALVVGGANAVSENVLSQLVKLKFRESGQDKPVFGDVIRAWGADRYATSVEVARFYEKLDDGRIDTDEEGYFYIATGDDFADALTGAVLAGWDNSGILLVKKDSIPSSVEKAINFQDNVDPDVSPYLTIFGGEAAVTLNNAVKMYNLVRYPAWAPR